MLSSPQKRAAMLLAMTVSVAVPTVAASEEAANAESVEKVLFKVSPEHDLFKFDYGPPSSPAMTLLGLTPDATPPSTSLKEFVVSLPSLYGEESGQSIALDFPISRLIAPRSAHTFNNYIDGGLLRRIGFRTRLGIAALNGSDGDGDPAKSVNSRLSIGLSSSLFDDSDPLMADGGFLRACFMRALDTAQPILDANVVSSAERRVWLLQRQSIQRELATLSSPQTPDGQARREELLAQLTAVEELLKPSEVARAEATSRQLAAAGVPQQYDRCVERANTMASIGRDLDVGIGVVAQGNPGRLEDLDWQGGAVWVAFREPLWPRAQPESYGSGFDANNKALTPTSTLMFLVSGRYGWDETLSTGNTTTPNFRADTFSAWAGLEWVTPRFRASAQYGWLETEARETIGKPFEQSGERYLLSTRFALGQDSGLWIGMSYGNAYGTAGDLDSETALITLSYSPGKADIAK